MVVNSLNFLLFFTVVFAVYWLPAVRSRCRVQNAWLLAASYFFYGMTDLAIMPVLLVATAAFYGLGLWLRSEMDKRHTRAASHITTLGVTAGVAMLLWFKYLDFFIDSFAALFRAAGLGVSWTTLNIVVPVGLSFFTFKLISYIIEIHREHITPERDAVSFALFVAFFPTILSGPIDRPGKFLPQLAKGRSFDYALATDGCRQVLWGMFTKMVIADNLATIIDRIWDGNFVFAESSQIWVMLLYPIQLYADFDGYSNMAIGVAKVLGIHIARNFNHPFLGRNIAEYWQRWHISLTSWLTDYVFSPLNIALRDRGQLGLILAIIINFLLIGLWHGANWTFAVFGLYHGLLYVPLILTGSFGKKKKLRPARWGLPSAADAARMMLTYALVAIGLVIFRAPTISDAHIFLRRLPHGMMNLKQGLQIIEVLGDHQPGKYMPLMVLALALLLMEWPCRKLEHNLQIEPGSWLAHHNVARWCLYLLIIIVTFTYCGTEQQFVYFNF